MPNTNSISGHDSPKSRTQIRRVLLTAVAVAVLLIPAILPATDAPTRPGNDSVWGPAAKDFVGTAVAAQSRVYSTGAEGVLGEVFYPTLDKVQNVDMQFLVTDAAKIWGDEERRQASHAVTLVDKRALEWQLVHRHPDGTVTEENRSTTQSSAANRSTGTLAVICWFRWQTVMTNSRVGSAPSSRTAARTSNGSFGSRPLNSALHRA